MYINEVPFAGEGGGIDETKAILLISFFLTLFLFKPFDAFAQIPQTERDALIALYNSTTGDGWTDNSGWKDGELDLEDGFALQGTECGWYGISCNFSMDRVQWVQINRNNLNGSIPPEIGNLTKLESLDLFGNQLAGSIPMELGDLDELVQLGLEQNQLSGSIPPEVANMNSLERLYLGENELNGVIPPEIGNLTNLTHLSLHKNQLSGSIPPEIGNLSNLIGIWLYLTDISGNIPKEIKHLTNLTYLYIFYTNLSGSIPPEIGMLTNLENVYLYDNKLAGCIPKEIGNLFKLNTLFLKNNMLSGEIPVELMNLTSLDNGSSDFRNNHLYTTNAELRVFLNQKQSGGDWETSQTFDTTIPMIEPSANCGFYTSGNCFESFEDTFTFSTSPTVIFVGEGEYQENVIIENGFTLELTWAHDFSCDPPNGPVIISGPSPSD